MTKQEVIKQAYGEHWESVKEFVDENGWFKMDYDIENVFANQFVSCCFESYEKNLPYGIRPSYLKGLETNNGWIKIESEKDLPESGYYEVVLRITKQITRGSITHSKPKAMVAYYSHYQPIKEIEKPLH